MTKDHVSARQGSGAVGLPAVAWTPPRGISRPPALHGLHACLSVSSSVIQSSHHSWPPIRRLTAIPPLLGGA
jgi:hypothetical protein